MLRECGDDLCRRVAEVLSRFAGEQGVALPARVAMVDFTADAVVAATEAAWVSLGSPG
jgi:hypothetical protein